MDALARVLLTNAAAAGLLAALAFLVSRSVRRPEVAHALWLLALLKLLTPPVVPLPLVPRWHGPWAPEAPTVVSLQPQPTTALPTPTAPLREVVRVVSERPRLVPVAEPPLLAAVVAGGAFAVLLLGATRFVRFRRLLAGAVPAPGGILRREAELAQALGLRRLPPVRLVPGRIPPMLWPEATGPVLLLPRELVAELSSTELDALLAHELAHVLRRDHWVRLLELAATALFWWYPVTWWARGALRRAEERCCDEWVLRVLPRSAPAYANGLLKSLTFLSTAPTPVPSLASGASPLYELETRLKEILMSRPAPRLSAPLRVGLLAAAGLGLAVFPTFARNDEPVATARPATAVRPAEPAPPVPATAQARSATPADAARSATTPRPATAPATPAPAVVPETAVERQSATSADAERSREAQQRAFEEKRRGLQRQELELQRQEIELRARAEQDEARACAERMRAEGKTSEAESCERHSELAGKRMELEKHRVELQAQRLELDAREQSEELALRMDLERVSEQGGRQAQELALKRLAEDRMRSGDKMLKRHRALEGEAQALEKQARELESLQRVDSVGAASEEFARALAAQIEAWKASLQDNPQARPELERELKRLEAALAALEAERP